MSSSTSSLRSITTLLYSLVTIARCAAGKEARTVAIAGVERTKSPIRSVRESRILTSPAAFQFAEIGFVRQRPRVRTSAPLSSRSARQAREPARKARLEMQSPQYVAWKPRCIGLIPGRKIRSPVGMTAHELYGRARLRLGLRDHPIHALRARTGLEMIDQRAWVKDGANTRRTQAQSDVDILPTVLGE